MPEKRKRQSKKTSTASHMLKHSKIIEFLMDVPLPILTNKWVIKREKLTPGLEAVFFRDDGADLHCFLKCNVRV